MKKRIISSLIVLLMIFTMLPNLVSAEENINYADNLVSLDRVSNNLFKIQVVDSSGKALSNGRMTVYSYLENRTVGDVFLDDNGKATFAYQPDIKLIEHDLAEKGVVDVHYSIFVANEEEVVVEGFTQTYYSPDFFVEDDSYVKKDSYLTHNLRTDTIQLLNVQTKRIEDDKRFEGVIDESVKGIVPMDGGGTIEIIETKNIGNKPTDFVAANAAKGCTVTATIQKGTKTTLSGGSILTVGFTASNDIVISQPTTVATFGAKYYFYTYYKYVEEKVRWTDGVSTIIYYQVRPTEWVGGINYVTYYESKNEVNPDTLSSYSTYGPNSSISVNGGVTITLGVAASFTGPISGIRYDVNMNHKTYSNNAVTRLHGNTTYYEYGTGRFILDKNITRY